MAAPSGIWQGLECPLPDELEVVVFGPGVAECVVAHVGEGRWIVVDSCVNPASKRAVALDYFDAIGIDVASAVKLVVATHWHDDHVRGIADVYTASRSAAFACSAALQCDEFFTLVDAGRRALFVAQSSGLDELRYVLDELQRRSPAVRREAIAPVCAVEACVLYRDDTGGLPAVLWAMSPSPATVQLAQHELASLIPRPGTPIRRIVRPTPNKDSVVVWVEVGGVRLLLGADLEESENPAAGWQAIVASDRLPAGKAAVVKVPHHGSENADNADIWRSRIDRLPWAVLTPFTKSDLPRTTDLRRLRDRTDELYCTAKRSSPPPRRARPVDDLARQVTKRRRVIAARMGFVRLRADLPAVGAPFRVSLHGAAYRVA